MAGFTDTLQGDRLARAQKALATLEGDSLRLDLRDSGLVILHHHIHRIHRVRRLALRAPTLSEEQRLRQERRMQLAGEREASEPHNQVAAQVGEERRRIWNANPNTNWMSMPPGDTLITEARETVKKRWVEQDIWNDKWN